MKRWLNIKSILEQIHVLTLLLKLRTKPITDRETNVYGYTEGYTARHEGRQYTVFSNILSTRGRPSRSWISSSTSHFTISPRRDSYNMMESRFTRTPSNISKVTKLRTSSATIKTSISSSRPYAYPSALTLFALTISSVALNKLLESSSPTSRSRHSFFPLRWNYLI
jgi:hypothetical protein